MKFELPKLNFNYNDLEPYIDAKTVEIHYTKHHQTYITNLNNALEDQPEFKNWNIDTLLKQLDKLPESIKVTVRNNGGGYHNHNLYWSIMSKNPQKEPAGALAEAINNDVGSLDLLKKQVNEVAMKRFGSGWAWLVKGQNGKLEIYSTPNQDSPLLNNDIPLLGVDVWEHAYYLKYQNRRNEYLDNWWNLVDWKEVENLFTM